MIVSICGVNYFFLMLSSVSISFFFLHLNLFWPLLFKFFPTSQCDHTYILFWNFPLICASNLLALVATCLICFSKLWILDLVSYWKDMIFCCNVIVLKAKVFIISRRSLLDDPITLKFVNVGISLDNSVGAEIHGGGTNGLDCLVEVGSHSIGSGDLSIQNYTC